MDESKKKNKTVDAYIKTFPDTVQDILKKVRATIQEVIPDGQDYMSYGIPAFKVNGRYLIYFAAWKQHISLYPFSSEMEKSFKEAAIYKTSGKGTIQFLLDQPIPYDLIKKIVQSRIKEAK